MKNFISLCLFAGALFIASCNTDPCNNVECGTQGACDAGACVCDTGYEKDANGLCNTAIRTKFLGSWVVSDTCTNSGTSSYTVTATAGTDITQVNLINFWDVFNNPVVATITNSKTFVINNQEPDNDNFFVESVGDGMMMDNGQLHVRYVVIEYDLLGNEINRDTCMGTWTK